MEQYKPPVPMDETPDPVNIPLPPSLPISIPVTQQMESIPLPPAKWTAPSSLDLIPLPWDVPPFPKITPQPSPPVASSSQLLPEPQISPPVVPSSEFPPIVSMTLSQTKSLLPRHLDSRTLSRDRPTPLEWQEFQQPPITGKRKELSPETEPSPPATLASRPPQVPPIRTTPLFEKHKEFVCEEGPIWKESQPSPSTGKRQESPQHVAMPLKRERSDPETQQSMSPEEQPTPPDSPGLVPTPPYSPKITAVSRPQIMMSPGRSTSQNSPALSTPSSFGLADLYRTPVQTIIEIEDELMEEGEILDSDLSMEEGQIANTRQSTPDSMDIGIPRVPSDWLQSSSP